MASLLPFIYLFLAALVIFPLIPLRWSLFVYLIIIHINLTTTNFASAVSIGFGNAITVIVLPAVLLLRTRLRSLIPALHNRVFWLWLIFCSYVVLASLWSPLKVSAFKQVGFLFSYTIIWLLFYYCFSVSKSKTYQVITWSLLLVIGLAFLQTYLIDTSLFEFGGTEKRFTSFTSAQGFALYLLGVYLIILSLWRKNLRRVPPHWFLIGLVFLALYLNGSRTGLVVALFITIYAILLWGALDKSFSRAVLLAGSSLAIFATIFISFTLASEANLADFREATAGSRSLQFIGNLVTGGRIEDVNTAQVRSDIYRTLWHQFQAKENGEKIVGSGTSSAAEIIVLSLISYRNFNAQTVDANRLAHNEFLRAIYEWGVIGLLLFVLFLVFLIIGCIQIARQNKSYEAYVLLAILPTLFLFLLVENIFAASVGPGGVALSMVFGQIAALQKASS